MWISLSSSHAPPTLLSSSHCINSPPPHLRLFFISSSCWKSPHHLVLPVVCLWIVYLLLLIYFYSARSTKYWLHFKPMQWPKNLSLPDIKNHIISLVICFYFILLLLFKNTSNVAHDSLFSFWAKSFLHMSKFLKGWWTIYDMWRELFIPNERVNLKSHC